MLVTCRFGVKSHLSFSPSIMPLVAYITIGTLEVGESHTPSRLAWFLMQHVVGE
jgi:hypothetical protein